ncbi:hypothetical protein D9619_007218 [Psilocybe cf. subviscida]|uniref:GSKIP domain-containing protein n=1 Tax=Psilocybe cf. subviscida TaxID=2480587 RepID=A0A8H5EWR4_9AGAR|nr:hypothetical protein D9619_007218 [Psilocybe cf. subviscida]
MPLVGLYKLRRGLSHVAKNLRTRLDPKSHMSSFCYTELQRALKEQTFGIKSYSVSSNSSNQAIALVVLLEGSKISVSLTTQGFSISGGSNVYETVEDLLQSVSPLYGQKRQELLFAKLSKLS